MAGNGVVGAVVVMELRYLAVAYTSVIVDGDGYAGGIAGLVVDDHGLSSTDRNISGGDGMQAAGAVDVGGVPTEAATHLGGISADRTAAVVVVLKQIGIVASTRDGAKTAGASSAGADGDIQNAAVLHRTPVENPNDTADIRIA